MDYLIFAIGLFLLAAALGAVFHAREDKGRSLWSFLVVGLIVLAAMGWVDLANFASGNQGTITAARNTLAAIACSSLLGFALNPSRRVVAIKEFLVWMLIVTAFVVPFVASFKPVYVFGRQVPIFLFSGAFCAFAAGWKLSGYLWDRLTGGRLVLRVCLGLALTLVTVIEFMPGTVDTIFDVHGQRLAPARVWELAAVVAAAVDSVLITFLVWSIRSRPGDESPLVRGGTGSAFIAIGFIVTVSYGAWLTHWLGSNAESEQTNTLLSAIRLGASTLDGKEIERLQGNPSDIDSSPYLSLRPKLLQIRAALAETRFVYLVGLRDKRLIYLVDAEPLDSPEFSPPGELLEPDLPKWYECLQGRSDFGGPDKDDYGTWYTAIIPIYSSGNPITPVAVIGVDYPAREWLKPMAARRLAAMGVTFSASCLLLALLSFHIISSEKNRRVDSLSERLSDAMNAAELDTWEWSPNLRKLILGPRASEVLELPPNNTLGHLWRRIHPAERRHLLHLVKHPAGRMRNSFEAEIRLCDKARHYRWYMLRGRVVEVDPNGNPARVVGTILNIDASFRARLEIERQRRFAQHVMESVPNGLAVVGATGKITYANPAFSTMTRIASARLSGMALTELVDTAESLTPAGSEARLLRPGVGHIPVQAFRASLSEGGEESGSIVSLVDLSTIRQAEQDLRRSRVEANRLALVAKRTDNAVVISDREGRIEWVNEGFTRMSGYTREEVIGHFHVTFLQHPDASSDERRRMYDQMRAGQPFEAEIQNRAKNGRAYLVSIECQPLLDRDNKLTGFMAIERDVTRDRRSSRLLEGVASISAELLSADRVESTWSGVIERLGRSVGTDRAYLFRFDPFDRPEDALAQRVVEWTGELAPRRTHNPELKNVSPYGIGLSAWMDGFLEGHETVRKLSTCPPNEVHVLVRQKILSVMTVPVFTGELLWGFMGFESCLEEKEWEPWEIAILKSAAANIGLRLVAEQESDAMRAARDDAQFAARAAEKANRAKSTFLATMSHEIRTPLNAVIGMASLLETTALNVQQKDYAETILRSSHFLLELINDILDYSRIESGKIELDHSPFSLPAICREIFDIVRVSSMGKELEMICRIAPHIPQSLRGDGGRLRQILINLLSNAVKFTPSGFVSLMVDGTTLPDGRWQLDFLVCDSGIGIAAESLQRLFTPFTQEDSSTTRRFGGSGLGLAISKRLANLMEGDIAVRSTPGSGSVFHLSVRFSATADAVPVQTQAPALPAGLQLRILIVDDNTLNRRILEEILASWGLPCHMAESGDDAVQLWHSHGPFDLVLTDHRMPGMDGTEMVRHLKTLPGGDRARYVLLGSDSGYSATFREQFDEVSSKPIWPANIHTTLSRLFPGATPAVPESASVTEAPDPDRLGTLRVLIAEDNPNNQKVVRLLLRRLGIEPVIVDDGKQAVDAVMANAYDVLFLDLQMPVMDGLEASRMLRDSPPPHRPYVIALTANAFQEDRDAAIAAGMDAYMAKPVTLVRLKEVLAAAMLAVT